MKALTISGLVLGSTLLAGCTLAPAEDAPYRFTVQISSMGCENFNASGESWSQKLLVAPDAALRIPLSPAIARDCVVSATGEDPVGPVGVWLEPGSAAMNWNLRIEAAVAGEPRTWTLTTNGGHFAFYAMKARSESGGLVPRWWSYSLRVERWSPWQERLGLSRLVEFMPNGRSTAEHHALPNCDAFRDAVQPQI